MPDAITYGQDCIALRVTLMLLSCYPALLLLCYPYLCFPVLLVIILIVTSETGTPVKKGLAVMTLMALY